MFDDWENPEWSLGVKVHSGLMFLIGFMCGVFFVVIFERV